jgi:hypothetical protein
MEIYVKYEKIKDYIKFYNDKNIDEMLQDKKDTKYIKWI